jgi:primosomal protein N'
MTPKSRLGSKFVKPSCVASFDYNQPNKKSSPNAQQRRALELKAWSNVFRHCSQPQRQRLYSHFARKKALVEIYDDAIRRDPLAETFASLMQRTRSPPRKYRFLAQIEQQMNSGSIQLSCCTASPAAARPRSTCAPMNKALSLGRSSMMLVPEIALTPVFSRRLRARFG